MEGTEYIGTYPKLKKKVKIDHTVFILYFFPKSAIFKNVIYFYDIFSGKGCVGSTQGHRHMVRNI